MKRRKHTSQKKRRADVKRENKRRDREQRRKEKKKLGDITMRIAEGHLSGVEDSPLLRKDYNKVLKDLIVAGRAGVSLR